MTMPLLDDWPLTKRLDGTAGGSYWAPSEAGNEQPGKIRLTEIHPDNYGLCGNL